MFPSMRGGDPAGPLHIPPRAFEARMPDGGRVSHDGRDVPIIHVQACMVDGHHAIMIAWARNPSPHLPRRHRHNAAHQPCKLGRV